MMSNEDEKNSEKTNTFVHHDMFYLPEEALRGDNVAYQGGGGGWRYCKVVLTHSSTNEKNSKHGNESRT